MEKKELKIEKEIAFKELKEITKALRNIIKSPKKLMEDKELLTEAHTWQKQWVAAANKAERATRAHAKKKKA